MLLDIIRNGGDSASSEPSRSAWGRPTEKVAVDAELPESVQAIRAMTREERHARLRKLEGG